MITEEKMSITEMILMPYFFEMSNWLNGQKVIQQENGQLTKAELLDLIRNDRKTIQTEHVTEYDKELATTIATLEELSEAQFQQLKMTILSWEPKAELVN
ncbi:hypothetical protein [Streptococcus merionis]|uniref:hypothetical protein n=1 Tax=Streptococcus merionis TaxID=400065 RepID=UPI003513252C